MIDIKLIRNNPELVKENIRKKFQDEKLVMVDEDPSNPYSPRITGQLQLSTEMSKIGINDGKYMTCFEMADRIKRLRSYFENRQQAMELVTTLRNFKAKVEKEMDISNDKRGTATFCNQDITLF